MLSKMASIHLKKLILIGAEIGNSNISIKTWVWRVEAEGANMWLGGGEVGGGLSQQLVSLRPGQPSLFHRR